MKLAALEDLLTGTRRAEFLARRLRQRLTIRCRMILRPGGVLPDFLIIGAMKSGTTTLFEMIEQHPGMISPLRKESQFFNIPKSYARGMSWYRAQFPTNSQIELLRRTLGYTPVTGEATPAMSAPDYAKNVSRHIPQAKLVVTLRNPVDRAWSHYQHYVRHPFRETLTFTQAIEREIKLLRGGTELNASNLEKYGPILQRKGYVRCGHYAEQLENWFRLFPRESFLILNFDRWKQNPEQIATEVADHLGLPPFKFEAKRANRGKYSELMPEACRSYLTEYFRPWNRRLFDLLGQDWGWPC